MLYGVRQTTKTQFEISVNKEVVGYVIKARRGYVGAMDELRDATHYMGKYARYDATRYVIETWLKEQTFEYQGFEITFKLHKSDLMISVFADGENIGAALQRDHLWNYKSNPNSDIRFRTLAAVAKKLLDQCLQ